MIRVESDMMSPNSRAGMAKVCHHHRVREIGQDFDKEGRFLRLERCQTCGLLMRQYLTS